MRHFLQKLAVEQLLHGRMTNSCGIQDHASAAAMEIKRSLNFLPGSRQLQPP